MQETKEMLVWSLGQGDPLEGGMANENINNTYFYILLLSLASSFLLFSLKDLLTF